MPESYQLRLIITHSVAVTITLMEDMAKGIVVMAIMGMDTQVPERIAKLACHRLPQAASE